MMQIEEDLATNLLSALDTTFDTYRSNLEIL